MDARVLVGTVLITTMHSIRDVDNSSFLDVEKRPGASGASTAASSTHGSNISGATLGTSEHDKPIFEGTNESQLKPCQGSFHQGTNLPCEGWTIYVTTSKEKGRIEDHGKCFQLVLHEGVCKPANKDRPGLMSTGIFAKQPCACPVDEFEKSFNAAKIGYCEGNHLPTDCCTGSFEDSGSLPCGGWTIFASGKDGHPDNRQCFVTIQDGHVCKAANKERDGVPRQKCTCPFQGVELEERYQAAVKVSKKAVAKKYILHAAGYRSIHNLAASILLQVLLALH